MMGTVFTKVYKDIPFCESEILRYSGCRATDEAVDGLVLTSIEKAKPVIAYRVCYCVLPLSIEKTRCDMGAFSLSSRALAKNLQGAEKVLVFAATLGAEFDRLIAKELVTSPAAAVMLDAVGTAQTEALCDCFCNEFEAENGVLLAPRFSPGYGDLDIDHQKDIFSCLDCQKHIGLSLIDSLLMSPSKSVTAFAAIKSQE